VALLSVMDCVSCSLLLWLDSSKRWGWRLAGHEVVNTVGRSNLIVGHTSPLSAVTWLADPGCELSGLRNVGHAMALQEVEVGSGIDGHGN
jgi:hypothetical protein